jgi:ribose transport system ATP-binding protein
LSLIPDLTAAENIWFGDEALSAVGTIAQRRINERTASLLARFGAKEIPLHVPVRALSVADRQILEIVKGLAHDPDILILDEATSALLPTEVDWLLDLARQRARDGKLVLYISHRLDEVRRVADRVTVLRNGETVGTEATAKLSDDDIVAMMLGRRLDRLFPARTSTVLPEVALRADGLKVGHQLRGVDFELHSGEVLGVAGLQGHGQRELFMALYGAQRAEGSITVRGKPVTVRGPRQALSKALGIALLPEDRRNQGLLLGKPIRENVVLSALGKIVRRGLVDIAAERRLVSEAVAQLSIKASSITAPQLAIERA